MEQIDYSALYQLQDRVLGAVFAHDVSLYLTGGTCLNRYYLQRRHSDDLDLLTNDAELFRDDTREVFLALKARDLEYRMVVDTRDFVRLMVADTLQVDLVNDRLPRIGRPTVRSDSIRIDSLENIAANKIGAVLGRDEPKDVFDLYLISRCAPVNWRTVIDDARRKAVVDMEVLEHRLRVFPIELVDQLAVSHPTFLSELKSDYSTMIEEIAALAESSLVRE